MLNADTALRRLAEVNMGIIVPAEELEKDPLPNAIALMELKDAIAKEQGIGDPTFQQLRQACVRARNNRPTLSGRTPIEFAFRRSPRHEFAGGQSAPSRAQP